MTAGPQKARSPYRRHSKAPYLYSAELRAWHRAVVANDARAIAEQHVAWVRKFCRVTAPKRARPNMAPPSGEAAE